MKLSPLSVPRHPAKDKFWVSHEILKVVGFMLALQTSNGESKIKYLFQELKTSQHKRHKPLKPNNEISQTHHKKQTHHNILKNTIMLS
jgi:hypothetical protein